MFVQIAKFATYTVGIIVSVFAFFGIGEVTTDVVICSAAVLDEGYCAASREDVAQVQQLVETRTDAIASQLYQLDLTIARVESTLAKGAAGGTVTEAKAAVMESRAALLALPVAQRTATSARSNDAALAARRSFAEVASAQSKRTGILGGRDVAYGIACAPLYPGIEILANTLTIEEDTGPTARRTIRYGQARRMNENELPAVRGQDFTDAQASQMASKYQSGCYAMRTAAGSARNPRDRGDYCVVALAVSTASRGSASVGRTVCRLSGEYEI